MVGKNANFLPGGGLNSVALPPGLSIGGNATYIGGAGTDSMITDAKIGGNLLCLLGAGADSFIYGTVPFVGGSALISGGPPAVGDIYLQFSFPTWTNTVLMFP